MKTALKWIMRIAGVLLIVLSFVEIECQVAEEPADPDEEDILI